MDASPIECTLTLEDDDYRDIVIDFVARLDARISEMKSLVSGGMFEKLENEAHWLKGAGGTVGYHPLTSTAGDLMIASREQDSDRCRRSLGEIVEIRKRMVVPERNSDATT